MRKDEIITFQLRCDVTIKPPFKKPDAAKCNLYKMNDLKHMEGVKRNSFAIGPYMYCMQSI